MKKAVKKVFIRTGTSKLIDLYMKQINSKSKMTLKLFERLKSEGIMDYPTNMKWEPTMRCNLNCVMCHQKDRRKVERDEINFEQSKQMFADMPEIKDVMLVGGEVFLRKDLFNIIEYLGNMGISVGIITNGTLISEKNIDRLLSLKNINSISFSIDGMKERHNAIRGSDSAFDKLLNAMKLTTNQGISITASCILQKDNLQDIEPLISLASDYDLDHMQFGIEMFSTPQEIKASKRMMDMGDLPFYPEIKETPNYDYSFEEIQHVRKLIKRNGRKYGLYTQLVPRIANDYPKEFLSGSIRKTNLILMCGVLFNPTVDTKGNLVVCPFIKKTFGNLLDTSLKEIWNSDELKDFRIRLLKNNLLPLCKRCCALEYLNF